MRPATTTVGAHISLGPLRDEHAAVRLDRNPHVFFRIGIEGNVSNRPPAVGLA
jgi:hypothetical protein